VPGVISVDLPVPARDQGKDVRADPERDHENYRRPAVPQQNSPKTRQRQHDGRVDLRTHGHASLQVVVAGSHADKIIIINETI